MMTDLDLQITPTTDQEEIPFNLLELADPSRAQIESYLKAGQCFLATVGEKVVGALVLTPVNPSTIEIKNIAVSESEQGKGYGKALLRYAEQASRKTGYKKLLIGTGNSSIAQLALYQKAGFEIERIEKDFFLKHYEEPIFENGIQCKHMVVLEKRLGE